MAIGAGGGGAQMQDGLHQADPNLEKLRPLGAQALPLPGTT